MGGFAANGYGLYDMSGNVKEWCNDWYDSSYYSSSPAADPRGADSGASRVIRGGDWWSNAWLSGVALRTNNYPNLRFTQYGFRLVLNEH